MRIKRILFAGVLLLVAATAFSAPPFPPGKWWRRPDFVQRLGLSEEQQTRLDQIFRNSADDLIDLKASVDKMSIAVHGELDQPQINRDALRRAANRLSDAQGKLFERELMMLVDMRGVLSDAQWARLRAELDRPPRGGERPPMQRPRP